MTNSFGPRRRPAIPRIAATEFGGPQRAGMLILGPSLGTSVRALWEVAAERLAEHVYVVGWDLPGHGRSPTAESPFTIAELAAAVVGLADDITGGAQFHYSGVSIGGAVGLQLLLDAPHRVRTASLLCTAAVIGTVHDWKSRAATARTTGTSAVADSAADRWFAAGFRDREPAVVSALINELRRTDGASYAQGCDVLANFDVTDRLTEITTPVLAIAGTADRVTPPECLRQIANGARVGWLEVLDRVGHLAPAEVPEQIANLLIGHLRRGDALYSAGMAMRREVLGDAHVERAIATTTAFTADFQDMITRNVWGGIWTRPGLDRRSRSLITLTALIARGHHADELAMHLRAARRNGLTNDEIEELVLQLALYCGVAEANSAFRIASQVLADYDADQT
ncbi:bifunctional 3-oxoadipate enol-lactonase/4-carboxymuconolactone decarboxylase PcaDC [Mycobacterium kansasii]|uniref:bifunctional 3-oxoadipate enol-lactonase/4-carboxymuconolactone decarboxylase PcaDC n=2 Tax=Mycobacterium kansasii TaxID=1768 RepID=UPI0015E21362